MIIKLLIGLTGSAALLWAYVRNNSQMSMSQQENTDEQDGDPLQESSKMQQWNQGGSLRQQLSEAADRLWESYTRLEDAKNTETAMKSLIYGNGILYYSEEARRLLLSDEDETRKSRQLLHRVANDLYNVTTRYVQRNGEQWAFRLSNKYEIGHDTLLFYAGYDTNVLVEDIKDLNKVICKLRTESANYDRQHNQLIGSEGYQRYKTICQELLPATMDFATLAEPEDEPAATIVLEYAKKFCDVIDIVNQCHHIIVKGTDTLNY